MFINITQILALLFSPFFVTNHLRLTPLPNNLLSKPLVNILNALPAFIYYILFFLLILLILRSLIFRKNVAISFLSCVVILDIMSNLFLNLITLQDNFNYYVTAIHFEIPQEIKLNYLKDQIGVFETIHVPTLQQNKFLFAQYVEVLTASIDPARLRQLSAPEISSYAKELVETSMQKATAVTESTTSSAITLLGYVCVVLWVAYMVAEKAVSVFPIDVDF